MNAEGKRRRRQRVLWIAALSVVAMLSISEWLYRHSFDSLLRMQQTAQTRTDVQLLQRALIDAESGQRGFLLTSRADDLKRYSDSTAIAHAALERLRAVAQGSQGDAAAISQLADAVTDRLAEMQTTLAFHADGHDDAWRDLLQTDASRAGMARFKTMAEALLELQNTRIREARDTIYDSLLWNRAASALAGLLGLLALAMYLRQTDELDGQHEALRQRLEVERDRLEMQVAERTALLTELASHLQSAREDERSKLARALHDELGALLTAAKLDVARLKSRLPEITVEASNRIAHLNETLNNGIALKRRIIEDLRPSSLGNLGLIAALDIQAHEFAERSGLQVTTSFEPAKLAPSVELTVYRLVQEALDNIARYASARCVDISMMSDNGHVLVAVRDDGRGFDTQLARPEAHGLVSMRYRIEAEQGQMQLESTIGVGTTLSARLPTLETQAKGKAAGDRATA